jgi:tRNA(Ile2) C34 agmatinyltransferase TiaS
MNLRCPHCGEQIVARGFGKCPGCYRDLPEELRLSPREREHEEMEEKWRKMDDHMREDGGGDGGMGGSSF